MFSEIGAELVLDVGCGAGRDTFVLGSCGAQVVGLDLAAAALAMARTRSDAGQIRPLWIQGDARCLPFAADSFDGAYCFGLLHEFVGGAAEDDVDRTMAELHRVLRPGGHAVVTALAGNPADGLPHVRLFSEAMFDAAVAPFECVEKAPRDDVGCTGRPEYRIWSGRLVKS
jgi:ubiquinone/menaquinone biosynthesis C-methylase UbiE